LLWLLALIHSNPILAIEVRSGRIPQDTRPVSVRQGPDRAIRSRGKANHYDVNMRLPGAAWLPKLTIPWVYAFPLSCY